MPTPDRPPSEGVLQLSAEVIRGVSDHAGTDSVDLPPLYEAVDPDALDKLFGPMPDGVPREGGEVTFSYAGYRVSVSIDRSIDVTVTEEPG